VTTALAVQLVVCSDGLVADLKRSGGQGLGNDEVAKICADNLDAHPESLATELCRAAQEAGSSDDVTVALLKLE
jgi:serine/threonine protein phosphatase PrpC